MRGLCIFLALLSALCLSFAEVAAPSDSAPNPAYDGVLERIESSADGGVDAGIFADIEALARSASTNDDWSRLHFIMFRLFLATESGPSESVLYCAKKVGDIWGAQIDWEIFKIHVYMNIMPEQIDGLGPYFSGMDPDSKLLTPAEKAAYREELKKNGEIARRQGEESLRHAYFDSMLEYARGYYLKARDRGALSEKSRRELGAWISFWKSRLGFHFDGFLSREVLENYLSRAVTLAEFANRENSAIDGAYPRKDEDVRFIKNTGAKFIGRAVYRWGREEALADPEFFEYARRLFAELHAFDPEIIFQACAFEAVYPGVEKVKVPAWAFEALGMEPEDRFFSYSAMLDPGGRYVGHWGGKGSVPDITRAETRLWFVYLVGSYVKIGAEAVHLGQVKLMGMNDPGMKVWAEFIGTLRRFADPLARRKKVIFDAHTPDGGMVVDGKSLLDFNSFPLRVREVLDSPMEGVLEAGYLDSLYGRSMGCMTPNGWACESLPYLVELDNFGISSHPGKAGLDDHFIWGYDEISWFYQKPKAEKEKWLEYAFKWLQEHDANAHLQMPGARVLTLGDGGGRKTCRAVAPSDEIPYGMDVEGVICEIWAENPLK